MPMEIFEHDEAAILKQGTDAWREIRLGRVTASRISDIVAKTKSGPRASRANYLAELITERLTRKAPERYVNAQMQWGTDHEPEARSRYELMTGNMVDEVGFVIHPSIEMSGASPDGHVAADGSLEIKCPGTAKHIETLLGEAIDGDYMTQIQWQLACSGRAWCDFVSYDPRLPSRMQLFIRRVQRDAGRIVELETETRIFLRELDTKIAELTRRFGQ